MVYMQFAGYLLLPPSLPPSHSLFLSLILTLSLILSLSISLPLSLSLILTSTLSASNISTRRQAVLSQIRDTDRWWVCRNLSTSNISKAPLWLRWMASRLARVFFTKRG